MYEKMDIVRLGWNDYAQRNFGNRHLSEELEYLSKFEKLLGKNSDILHAGCGTGRPVMEYFQNKNHNLTGVDISGKQIEKAKIYFPKARFVEGNILDVLDGDKKYDAIVSLRTIEHIQRERHKELVDLFYDSIKPGGKLLLSHPLTAKDVVVPLVEDIQMYYSNFDYQTFVSILGSTKFKQIYQKINNKRIYFILSKANVIEKPVTISFKPQLLYSS